MVGRQPPPAAPPAARRHAVHRPSAFVGEPGTQPAGAYHDADFDWAAHAAAVGPGLEAALAAKAAAAAVAALASPDGAASAPAAPPGAAITAPPPLPPPRYEAAWSSFHAKCNASARFYKERRYITLAWPALADPATTRFVLELGCGAGSALLPVLRANPATTALGVDVSAGAVSMFLASAARAGIAPSRVQGLVLDAAADGAAAVLARLNADACLAVFTLGALAPPGQAAFLRAAAAALRPGGVLYVRDHGRYDVTHLRAPLRVSGNLHRRSDGTLCYFFDPPGLAASAEAAGFTVRACKWVTVAVPNRATGAVLKRVFVSGEFVKL